MATWDDNGESSSKLEEYEANFPLMVKLEIEEVTINMKKNNSRLATIS